MPGTNPRVASSVLVAIVLVAALGCGCSNRSASSRGSSLAQSPPAESQKSSGRPVTSSLLDVAAPRLTYRQLELPPGTEITDYTDHIAAYSRNSLEFPHPVFGLVDLASGRHRLVLSEGVNEALGYNTVAPRISDSWMAWEELDPDETNDPRNATWRLYAAPIDSANLAIGKPKLIDGGVTNYKLRPHYVVIGTTVFWTANREAGPHQESFPRFGTLEALDLETGRSRTVRRTNTSFVTLCAADGVLSVTESVSDETPERERVLLLDPATGMSLLTVELENDGPLSHFVRVSPDWFSWAVFPEEGAEWPDLHFSRRTRQVASAGGEDGVSSPSGTFMAGARSIDPAFFGRYVAFESVDTSRNESTAGVRTRVRRIWVADPERRVRAVLLETRDETRGGWWQTCASEQRTDTLLLWNDLGPWLEDQDEARTLVRLYRAPPPK